MRARLVCRSIAFFGGEPESYCRVSLARLSEAEKVRPVDVKWQVALALGVWDADKCEAVAKGLESAVLFVYDVWCE